MYFTNPTKVNYDLPLSNTWAVTFDDKSFNILSSVDGTPIFPASDVSFKELTISNTSLQIGISGVLDMGTPSCVIGTTQIDINFIDNDNQDINTAIRKWIKDSPVYTKSRSLHITKSSQYTKTVTLYKLKKDGTQASGDSKLVFTVFPSEELVQDFNSDMAFRTDKLSLRCY
jgi:hypothetical protein